MTIAVNDVAVHKGGVARVVRVNVFIQGENVGPYSADGIIVATPTGSTAYSLSAGGPIVVPGVEAMVVTPIAAHTLAVRPLVVPATYRIVIEPMEGWSEDLLVSFDGQTGSALAPGESVDVRRPIIASASSGSAATGSSDGCGRSCTGATCRSGGAR